MQMQDDICRNEQNVEYMGGKENRQSYSNMWKQN